MPSPSFQELCLSSSSMLRSGLVMEEPLTRNRVQESPSRPGAMSSAAGAGRLGCPQDHLLLGSQIARVRPQSHVLRRGELDFPNTF